VRFRLAAISLILVVSSVATLGCGGDGGTQPTTTSTAQPATHHPRRPPDVKTCSKGSQGHTFPAKIEGQVLGGDITTTVLSYENAWIAGDCTGRTIVYAGSAGFTRGMGLAIIARFGHASKQLGGGLIAVPNGGQLKITQAPSGPAVETSAQRSGEIQFTSDRGVRGTIHLGDNSATLSNGEVIQAVPDVRSIDSG
jgi:hypothetical protein